MKFAIDATLLAFANVDYSDIERRIVEALTQSIEDQLFMARIPESVQTLSAGKPQELIKLLIAAILSAVDEEGEEPMLVVKDADVRRAQNFTLVTTVIEEEHSIVLTVRPK